MSRLWRNFRRRRSAATSPVNSAPLAVSRNMESLEQRSLLTNSATESAASGTLTVIGDQNDNAIEISRGDQGAPRVKNHAVTIRGGSLTIAARQRIFTFGRCGNDVISLNESNEVLLRATRDGDTGRDRLTCGSVDESRPICGDPCDQRRSLQVRVVRADSHSGRSTSLTADNWRL